MDTNPGYVNIVAKDFIKKATTRNIDLLTLVITSLILVIFVRRDFVAILT